jgi:hypothetical protein
MASRGSLVEQEILPTSIGSASTLIRSLFNPD